MCWVPVLDDSSGCGGDLPESMNMRHDIVPSLFLLDRSDLELLFVQVLQTEQKGSPDTRYVQLCEGLGGLYIRW